MSARKTPAWRIGLALATVLATTLAAQADEGSRGPRVPLLPKVKQECTSCHGAYAPGLLPAESWQRLMNTLPQHFGTDASLDAAAAKEITTWLTANAGTYKRVREAPPGDRITKSAWFVRKHDEVPATTWKRASIQSPANCNACHAQADQGDFNEHAVRIPR